MTTTPASSVAPLWKRAAGTHQRSSSTLEVLAEMERNGLPLSATELSKRAGVSRAYVYRQGEVLAALEAARERRRTSQVSGLQATGEVTAQSLKVELVTERELVKSLRRERDAAVRRVAEPVGEQVASEGDPQVDWKRQAVELKEEVDRLRIENRRLQEDLDATRSRNRILTKQLNQKDTSVS